MALEKTKVIDRVGVEAGTGHVVLTVLDEMDWSDDQRHLLALQQKLNTYLSFVERGEVFRRLARAGTAPVSRTAPVKVGIVAKHPFPPYAMAFLEYARHVFESSGMELSCEVGKEVSGVTGLGSTRRHSE
jgi:uncharacterized protein DUF6572